MSLLLLLLVAGLAIAQVHGAPVAGLTCASRSQGDPAAYQAGVNNWVDEQRSERYGGRPGSTCGSIPPEGQQSCVNEYIEANLQPPGITDVCGAAPDKQACLNGLVDTAMQQQQQQQAAAGGGAPAPEGRRLLGVASAPAAWKA